MWRYQKKIKAKLALIAAKQRGIGIEKWRRAAIQRRHQPGKRKLAASASAARRASAAGGAQKLESESVSAKMASRIGVETGGIMAALFSEMKRHQCRRRVISNENGNVEEISISVAKCVNRQ
jgi:hypothetical protein